MAIFVETERLLLREIVEADVDALFAMDSDPEVHRYLGNEPVTDKQQIVDVIQFIRRQYKDHGIGRWAIIDKQTNECIGWSGLKWVTEPINNHVHYYDLGYRLQQQYWGQGIATESAVGVLQYAFDVLQANEVFAIADVANTGSNKILQKIGMQQIETFLYDGTPHHWYKAERKI